jgi:hypothetical protein
VVVTIDGSAALDELVICATESEDPPDEEDPEVDTGLGGELEGGPL